jgi:hypothetical protein
MGGEQIGAVDLRREVGAGRVEEQVADRQQRRERPGGQGLEP